MKFFATAFLLASSAISASAFSAVAPPSAVDPSKAANVAEPVDKTLKGIDADGSFDPVEGDHAAVTRNNNDEVWVQQVRILNFILDYRRMAEFVGRIPTRLWKIKKSFCRLTQFFCHYRDNALAATASHPLSDPWSARTLSLLQTLSTPSSSTTKIPTKPLNPCLDASVTPSTAC